MEKPQVVLVEKGTSPYVIYVPKNAPSSVREGGSELQRVIEVSTGCRLPIVDAPAKPMLALGESEPARRAGIDTSKLPLEGFCIRTSGRDVFIAGKDTNDGEKTAAGGVSDGTFHGVMDFLERFVGARWLLPTGIGEDIPQHTTLALPQVSFEDSPDFAFRSLAMGFGALSTPWLRRLRIAPDRQQRPASHSGHAWELYGMPERLKEAPAEYMALVDGKRVDTVYQTKAGTFYPPMQERKYCTTNEGLLDLFANSLLEEMEKHPEKTMWAISPSDGGGWCECEKCAALDERAEWTGNRGYGFVSKTPHVLRFYNEIARRVRAKQPDKLLGIYFYAAYTYPPANPTPIEPNLRMFLAVRPYYGFTLYREDYAAELPKLLDAWQQIMPIIGWTDYSTYVGTDVPMGTPYPPGISILKLVFTELHKHGVSEVEWDSSSGLVQGWGSLHNYLAAKLLWDADADVDSLQDEWLSRAYGPGAPFMKEIYALLDQKLAAYKRDNPKDHNYDANSAQIRAIHLPLFPQMKSLYLQALSKADTEAQRKRLEMFGDNLIVLHWQLRQADWLENPKESTFYRSDEDYKKFLERSSASPSISRSNPPPEFFLKPLLEKSTPDPASMHR